MMRVFTCVIQLLSIKSLVLTLVIGAASRVPTEASSRPVSSLSSNENELFLVPGEHSDSRQLSNNDRYLPDERLDGSISDELDLIAADYLYPSITNQKDATEDQILAPEIMDAELDDQSAGAHDFTRDNVIGATESDLRLQEAHEQDLYGLKRLLALARKAVSRSLREAQARPKQQSGLSFSDLVAETTLALQSQTDSNALLAALLSGEETTEELNLDINVQELVNILERAVRLARVELSRLRRRRKSLRRIKRATSVQGSRHSKLSVVAKTRKKCNGNLHCVLRKLHLKTLSKIRGQYAKKMLRRRGVQSKVLCGRDDVKCIVRHLHIRALKRLKRLHKKHLQSLSKHGRRRQIKSVSRKRARSRKARRALRLRQLRRRSLDRSRKTRRALRLRQLHKRALDQIRTLHERHLKSFKINRAAKKKGSKLSRSSRIRYGKKQNKSRSMKKFLKSLTNLHREHLLRIAKARRSHRNNDSKTLSDDSWWSRVREAETDLVEDGVRSDASGQYSDIPAFEESEVNDNGTGVAYKPTAWHVAAVAAVVVMSIGLLVNNMLRRRGYRAMKSNNGAGSSYPVTDSHSDSMHLV